MAVRLLVNRFGLGSLSDELKTNGVAFAAFCARVELVRREDFVIRMLVEFPPDDPNESADVVLEMAAEMAIFDSSDGTRYLHQLLGRLLRRSTSWRTQYDQEPNIAMLKGGRHRDREVGD